MLRTLIGFALAAGLASTSAQAQEVAGNWAVNFDRLITRTPEGRDTVTERGKALLVIEVKGDSAFGTWTVEGPGGQPRKLRGTRTRNTVKLVSEPVSGRRVQNGTSTEVIMINTFEATVTGDAIVGTLTTRPQNTQEPAAGGPARKFDGKREKR